jgi:phosphoglycolate phosphatase
MINKLVMFDFDGVLIDTLILSYELSAEVNDGLQLSQFKDKFHGNIIESLREHGGTFNANPEFFKKYGVGTREVRIPEELLSILDYLKNKEDIIMSIVSSTPSSNIREILDRQNVSDHFSDLYGSDVDKSKVVKIKTLLEKYDIQPEHAVFITDTVGDVKEAKDCGVKSIAVSWGFHEKERLEQAEPYRIVDGPMDLLENIKEFLS